MARRGPELIVRLAAYGPRFEYLSVRPSRPYWPHSQRFTLGIYKQPDREAYTVNGAGHTFKRAVIRAGITTGDVTLHTQGADADALARGHKLFTE